MDRFQLAELFAELEQMRSAAELQFMKRHATPSRIFDETLSDEDYSREALKRAIGKQNQARAQYPTDKYFSLPMLDRAVPMDTTENVQLVNSGVLDISFPMSRTYLGLAGVDFRSRMFTEKNTAARHKDILPAQHLNEDEELTPVDGGTEEQPFQYATVGCHVPVSRRLRKQASSIGIDVVNDIIAEQYKAIDRAMQRGALDGNAATSAGREPDGLFQLATNKTDLTGAHMTQSDFANAIANLANRHVDVNRISCFMGASILNYYMTTPVQSGGTVMLVIQSGDSPSGLLLLSSEQSKGIPCYVDTDMAQNRIALGDFAHMQLWMNEVVDVTVISSNRSNKNSIFSFCDYAPLITDQAGFEVFTQVGSLDA